jgi:hypothetical protein
MSHVSWFLWGFAATVVLTTIMAASQSLGFTRMNIPYLLGTMFTANRDRARVIGVAVHLLVGWLFAFLYAAIFQAWAAAGWWRGAMIGFVHSAFVLVVGMPILPGIHPRMASEQQGPTPKRQLEPPGQLGLHYGAGTPLSVVLAHVVYGAILGGFYRLA